MKNPNVQLQKRKVIGMEVMNGLVYNENNNDWEDGRIYDASSGKNWNANALIMEDGCLKVRGFWHLKCLGQDIIFKRVSSNIQS